MITRLTHIVPTVLILSVLHAATTHGQYMYLDVSGDGENTAADTLGTSGTFSVGVWLITNRDRAGAVARCTTGEDLTVNSYEVILRSVGGSLRWDGYQNSQPGMSTPLQTRMAGSDFYFGYAGGEALPPGKYRLGTAGVTVTSGSPSIAVVPDTPLGPTLHTSFGSACPGADADNTMELGSDWLDVGGINAGSGHGNEQPQSLAVDGKGHFFLGGNEIAGYSCFLVASIATREPT